MNRYVVPNPRNSEESDSRHAAESLAVFTAVQCLGWANTRPWPSAGRGGGVSITPALDRVGPVAHVFRMGPAQAQRPFGGGLGPQ